MKAIISARERFYSQKAAKQLGIRGINYQFEDWQHGTPPLCIRILTDNGSQIGVSNSVYDTIDTINWSTNGQLQTA